MNLELAGKRVIVTGASRGIGACIAEAFAAEGADLALIARSAEGLDQVLSRLEPHGAKGVAIVADLARPDDPGEAIGRALDRLGGVDVLVNNAGASPFGSFDAITDRDWLDAFDLKLMGYVRCIRATLPPMREQGWGTIINVVGAAGRNATAGYVLGAFNAALLHLTKSLGEHAAGDGIRLTALNPGFTNTERMRTAMEVWANAASMDARSYTSRYVSRLPLGRFAEPEEIARMAVLLASDHFALAVGSSLQADGGTSPF